jgi:hypothetical protein
VLTILSRRKLTKGLEEEKKEIIKEEGLV